MLDIFYWGVQVACFVLAGLAFLFALQMLWIDWTFTRSIPEEARTMGDTYYIVRPLANFTNMLITTAVPLGIGGILHWLRRIAGRRVEAAQ